MSWIDRLMGRPDAPIDYDRLMRMRVPDLSRPVRKSRDDSAPLLVTAIADAADSECGCSDSGGGSCSGD